VRTPDELWRRFPKENSFVPAGYAFAVGELPSDWRTEEPLQSPSSSPNEQSKARVLGYYLFRRKLLLTRNPTHSVPGRTLVAQRARNRPCEEPLLAELLGTAWRSQARQPGSIRRSQSLHRRRSRLLDSTAGSEVTFT
jgi:hypothetical protein